MLIPLELIAGDSSTWNDPATKDNLGNLISSPEWTLAYILNGSSKLTLNSGDLNGGWTTTISAAQSAVLTAGVYYWQSFAVKGSERITINSGKITIKENLSTAAAGFDARTQTRIDLDNVQLAIRTMVSGGAVQEYKVNNREIKKMTLGELRSYESQLKVQIVKEERNQKIKNGEGDPYSLKIRFK